MAPVQPVGYHGQLIPQIGWVITTPDVMLRTKGFLTIHRRAAKNALRTTLLWHKAKRLREHFKQTNRHKYDHKPRKSVTKNIKRAKHGSITDLVMKGETRDKMLGELPKIRIGGSADAILRGRMFLSFPFPVDLSVRHPENVTPADMADEIGRWTHSEVNQAAQEYGEFYVRELQTELATRPRLRKRIGSRLPG